MYKRLNLTPRTFVTLAHYGEDDANTYANTHKQAKRPALQFARNPHGPHIWLSVNYGKRASFVFMLYRLRPDQIRQRRA